MATPIGTARDITLRALDILASVDVLAAEDTRSLRRLMDIHGIPLGGRRRMTYHDHSREGDRKRLEEAISAGAAVAYASEAGMPLISDPGFELARAVQSAGHTVTVAPGASAVTSALAIAGLPTDAFLFAGFLPNARTARRARLEALKPVDATLVFFESPNRVAASLADAQSVLGGEREAALCRELTKRFEEVRKGTLAELAEGAKEVPPKGEIVLVVDRGRSDGVKADELEQELVAALDHMSVKDAAEMVAAAHKVPKRQVYQMALKLAKG